MIVKQLLMSLLLATIVLFTGCEKDDFIETVGVCPVVIATDPVNGAINIPLDQVVTATFNEEMNASTFTNTSFTVQGATPIAGTVSFSGVIAKFIPSAPLEANTTYIAKITTTVKDLMGNALQEDYIWTFSTGATITPIVTSTDPTNNETDVVLNKTIAATFNVPMDNATINASTFTLKQGVTPVTGTVTYSGTTAYFTPTVALIANAEYTATITTDAKNLQGTSIANNYVWKFTTGIAVAPIVILTDPANSATNVVLNQIISATFDMPMDNTTINATTVTLKQGAIPITGTVTYSGTTAYFTPTVVLSPSTEYTGTITTGAKNLQGIPIANNYVWKFTTGIAVAPIVILTDPASNAINVALNKIVTATFDMPMDPLTITNATFLLKVGSTPVSGAVTYLGSTATFTPSVALLPNTTYTATIKAGAKNVAGIPIANDYVWNFSTITTPTGSGIDLASAENFGILAGVGISNNAGFSEIRDMNVGISPGVRSSITGFPPAIIVNGFMYASDDIAPPGVAAMLIQAKQDLTNVYLFVEGMPATATVSGDQGGLTLAPGVYKSTSTLLIQSGDLTLDAQGDANAIFVFQVASAFTTVGGAGGNIILTNGAQAKNVYWQTGSSATIGDYTAFKGNILALSSITMGSHSTAVGRMLARNGAVVMTDTNIINRP